MDLKPALSEVEGCHKGHKINAGFRQCLVNHNSTGLVSGHNFSCAAKAKKMNRASAPEGDLSPLAECPVDSSDTA